MSELGHERRFSDVGLMSAFGRQNVVLQQLVHFKRPCVDGSELAREIFTHKWRRFK
jgi:hypothetical protein